MTKEEFQQKFKEAFLEGYKNKKIKYLWEPFAKNEIECLKGNLARKAYDNADKTNVFEIQYDNGLIGDDFAVPLEKNHMTSNEVDKSELFEFYIFDKEFSWCYIITHEFNLCGPYFIKRK